MVLDIYQVDAFSKGPFSGNPAAVIPLTHWLSDELLQQIAEENNLSETAFFTENNGQYHIRWFTPTVEVALCGHATLATAFVIFTELAYAQSIIHFKSMSGSISVAEDGQMLTLDFPTDQLVQITQIPENLVKSLGIQPIELWKGRDDFMCVLQNQKEVESLQPDFSLLKSIDARGVLVTSIGDGILDFVSRGFFPQSGIDEDPATGSAHTTLTPYWSKRLGKTDLSACQLSYRKGYFKCIDMGDRTLISGKADLYLKGQIYL